jgi:hypothetical protein
MRVIDLFLWAVCAAVAYYVIENSTFYIRKWFPPRTIYRRIKIKDVVYIPMSDLNQNLTDQFWKYRDAQPYEARWQWHVECNKIICIEETEWNNFLKTYNYDTTGSN